MPTPRKFSRDGGPISLAEFDRQSEAVARIDKITVAPPLEMVQHAAAVHLRLKGTLGTVASPDIGGRVVPNVRSLDGTTVYVFDGSSPPIYYYLGNVQGKAPGFGTPPDTGVLVWLEVYYQYGVWGSAGVNQQLLEGRAYTCVPLGFSKALAINLNDGGGDPPTDNVTLTLPVFRTYFLAPSMSCDSFEPILSPGAS